MSIRPMLTFGLAILLCAARLAPAATIVSESDKTGGFLLATPASALNAASLFDAIEQTKAAGGRLIHLEFGQKLGTVDATVFNEDLSADRIGQLKARLAAANLKAFSASVTLDGEAKRYEKVFQLAQNLGLSTLVVELSGDAAQWVPKVEGQNTALDRLRGAADKFDINVALINPVKAEGSRLSDPNYLMALVTNRTVRLGVCVDTRHFVQSGIKPLGGLKALNTRVFACRLGDLTQATAQGEPVPFGAGALDIKEVLVELKRQVFDGPLVVAAGVAKSSEDLAKCHDFVGREGEKAAAAGKLAAEQDVRVLNGFRYEIIAQENIPEPMDLCFSPDGRLWVTGRDGHLWTINTTTFDKRQVGKIQLDKRGDYGLHGFDFDPHFSQNGFVYMFYSPQFGDKPTMRVSRFTVSDNGSGILQTNTEKTLIEYNIASGGQHVGGAVRYRPSDGKLYVTTGDNNRIVDLQKYFEDPDNQAQNLNDLRGKVLRLNLDGSIPTDNPYYGQAGKRGEIFTRGHRQPFSLHVDPKNGNLYDGENGGDRNEDFEEINLLVPGGNYGWPRWIGNNLGNFGGTNSANNTLKPWLTYPRYMGGSCVGGPFYRATTGKHAFPAEFRDGMFYGDYNRKSVRFARVDPANNTVIKTEPFAMNFAGGPVALTVGPDGALYLLEYGGWFRASQKDRVARITYDVKNLPAP